MSVPNILDRLPDGWSLYSMYDFRPDSGKAFVEIWTGEYPVRWGNGDNFEQAIDMAVAKVTAPTGESDRE